MPLKTFYDENCPHCGKKQTGRLVSNDRTWWTPCDCKQLPNCPVDYPRVVSKKRILKDIKCFKELPLDFQRLCLHDLRQATGG